MQGSGQRLKMEPEQEMVVGKWDLGVGIIWRRQTACNVLAYGMTAVSG